MQARLLEDFDVEEVRESLGIERCWSLYSQHIVKLRSIEIALIKEELRALRAAAATATAAAAQI